jgi:type IV secretory pathway TraG/TraD family ATPase VirD4
MVRLSKTAGIILVLVLGFLVQAIFSFADSIDTPRKAVVQFSKAYFKLDKSMAKRICKKRLASEDVDVVDQYIFFAAKEAKEKGFDISFMKNKLYDIKSETIFKKDNEARVRITGKIRVSINPVYTIVAKLFNIGATHEVDEIINVIKEDGKWKVCGNLFSLPVT